MLHTSELGIHIPHKRATAEYNALWPIHSAFDITSVRSIPVHDGFEAEIALIGTGSKKTWKLRAVNRDERAIFVLLIPRTHFELHTCLASFAVRLLGFSWASQNCS